ncbi:MAG: carbohydrate ABC transporter permease [Acidimicrobiales bacterium]|jgi:multiple sugar transport system permease protein
MQTSHATTLAKVARSARRLSANTVLLLMAPLFLAPVIWTVVQSFLPGSGALKIPPVWVTAHPTIANYSSVFNLIPFLTFLFNSVKITLIVTFGSLVTSALAAYAFARLRFPGRNALFFMFLAALMVPNVVTAAPTYVLMHSLHLATSQTAVWLPGLINVFGIFLLRQFFRGIPRDLEDAGRVDGLTTLGVLRRVILPLSRPALAALAILIGTTTWNDYFWPSIYLTNRSQMTLTVGLVSLQGEYKEGSPLVMFAAVSMTVLPLLILFLFTQRAITQSLAMTSFR